MPIIRRSDCVPLPTIVCPVVAVVMLEIRVARCVHCLKAGNILHTLHTSFYPTLQHHNSYNRTDNYRQWNAVGFPDDGHKDARNMLRYYRLPINHYLLHLVGFSFTYLSKMHGLLNINFTTRMPTEITNFCTIARQVKQPKPSRSSCRQILFTDVR